MISSIHSTVLKHRPLAHKFNCLKFALLSALLFICLSVSCFSYASALVNGGSITDSIAVSGQKDSHSFYAVTGEYINLSVSDLNQTGLYLRMTLYAPNGSYITYGQGSVVASITNRMLPSTGIYTVVVQDVSGGHAQTGDYELHFTKMAGANEHGELVNGGSRAETITQGDLDSYTFDGSAGEYINLSVSDLSQTGLYLRMTLYAPDGSYITYGQGSYVGSITNISLPSSGIYTLVVQDVSGGHAQTGDYELHFTKMAGANEHGELINGSSITQTITQGDLDSYTFDGLAGEYINLSVSDINQTGLYIRMTLYAPDGSYFTYGQGSFVGSITNRILPSTGIYTLVVQDVSGGHAQTGDYELHFTKMAGANEHGELINGGSVAESITQGDLDSYTFAAAAGDYINLSVSDIEQTGLYLRITLYAPDGSYITYGQGSFVGSITNRSLPSTGIYTLVVQDVSGGHAQTGDYELHFTKMAGANEHGELINGGSVAESITQGDLDSYTFAAAAGDYINLSVSDIEQTGLYLRITLYAPDGSYITYGQGSFVGSITNRSLPSTGIYTLVVQDVSGGHAQTGDYALHFTRMAGANEHGRLIYGSSVTQTITQGDLDSYTFAASAGNSVNLSVYDLDQTGLYLRITLYAPDGSYITYGQGSVVGSITNRLLTSTGIYTLVVQDVSSGHAQTGDYELHFTRTPSSD